MQFFRYYQRGDTGKWLPTPVENVENPMEVFSIIKDATKTSVLAVTTPVNSGGVVKYAGPLFFDIDNLNDLSSALQSAVTLCNALEEYGVDPEDIQVRLSGKKGVHVFLDSRIFSDGSASEILPEIHKRIAFRFKDQNLDMQVYSSGRGRMIRGTNQMRDDGKYVVPIHLSELKEMTEERYRELCSAPRPDWEEPWRPNTKAEKLSKLFLESSDVEPIKNEGKGYTDMTLFDGEIPACILSLAEGRRDRTGGSFNQVAFNVACWSSRSGKTNQELTPVFLRIAESNPSKKGDSTLHRARELHAMHNYVVNEGDKYKFYCGGMLKVITDKPCDGCPMEGLVANNLRLMPFKVYSSSGQYFLDRDLTKPITTFTIKRNSVTVDEDTGAVISSNLTISSPGTGKTYNIPNFDEECWSSKAKFKEGLNGLDGVSFVGNEDDVTKIRNTVVEEEQKNGDKHNVQFKAIKIGINYKRRRGPNDIHDPEHVGRFTYVEDGFSYNDVGVSDTHVLVVNADPSPSLRYTPDFHAPVSKKSCDALRLLCRSNFPGQMSQLLGWYLATHLKTHFQLLWNHFPILSVTGIAGTGKNSIVGVLQRLSGLEGAAALRTLEAPNSTKLPFQVALTDSATIPRVINEVNPKSLGYHQYRNLLEMIKATFDSQTIVKGRIGGGDKTGANVSTVAWKITAPLVTLSEEPFVEPAVTQRTVTVKLSRKGLTHGKHAFDQLKQRADDLLPIARTLILGALSTKLKHVNNMYDNTQLPCEVLEQGIPERVLFGYRAILVAYNWTIGIMQSIEAAMDFDTLRALVEMREAFLQHIKTEAGTISAEASVSEVDRIINQIAVMAYANKLERNKHYAVDDDSVYLDIVVIYPLLQSESRMSGQMLSMREAEIFLRVVTDVDYFETLNGQCPLINTNGRGILKLDKMKMFEANLFVQMFTGQG